MEHRRKHRYFYLSVFIAVLFIMTSCNSNSLHNGIIKEKSDLAVFDMTIEDYCTKYNQKLSQKYSAQSDIDKYKISISDFKLDAENVDGMNFYVAVVPVDGFSSQSEMGINIGCSPTSNKISQMKTVAIMSKDCQEMALSVLHDDALPLLEKIQEEVKSQTGDPNNVGSYVGVFKNILIIREKDEGNGQLLSNLFSITIAAITEEMKKDLPSSCTRYDSI